jgi:hypothetical protein
VEVAGFAFPLVGGDPFQPSSGDIEQGHVGEAVERVRRDQQFAPVGATPSVALKELPGWRADQTRSR